MGRRTVWIDVEVDGKLHLERANDDARRAAGLRLPCLRYSTWTLLRDDFPQRLLREVQFIHDRGC